MLLDERSVSAMDLPYVVDSEATRDALPTVMFQKRTPTRSAEISTSNGAAEPGVYVGAAVLRLRQGAAVAEKREVLVIDGPPVLSLGYPDPQVAGQRPLLRPCQLARPEVPRQAPRCSDPLRC